jgi:ArsR family transcriptional regulator, cadmium/lead-responsive transcriptional repressor
VSGRVDAVFSALSDPTRRTVMAKLADEPRTATELASELPVSRQAVAKHLALLRDAELVRSRREGRETRFALTPDALETAMVWMLSVEPASHERLERLRRRLDDLPG